MGLREALPLIAALGAASPFWFGMDSGLASARSAVIRAYPGRGVPPPLSGWDEYLETLDGIALGGGPDDHTMVWWDARLQPRLGTVEVRELDVQTGVEETRAIAALVHVLARRAVEQPPRELAPAQALHWSSFRAVRDGLDAELLFGGRRRPAREAAAELLEQLRGEDDALEGVQRIVGLGRLLRRAAPLEQPEVVLAPLRPLGLPGGQLVAGGPGAARQRRRRDDDGEQEAAGHADDGSQVDQDGPGPRRAGVLVVGRSTGRP